MKTFVVFTCCKVTLSSGEGCLNMPRVFDLAAKLGFLVFLFWGDFFSTKMNSCFSRKEETNFENQKWNGQWLPNPKTNSKSLLWVFKNEMTYLHHKSPNQNDKTQRKLYFWCATWVISIFIFATAKMRNFRHFIFVLGDPASIVSPRVCLHDVESKCCHLLIQKLKAEARHQPCCLHIRAFLRAVFVLGCSPLACSNHKLFNDKHQHRSNVLLLQSNRSNSLGVYMQKLWAGAFMKL